MRTLNTPFRPPTCVRRRMTPPPCGARKTLRTFVCLRFSTAAEIPASLLNALPHLPFPGLFHDGPPTARLRRFRSRFFCHRQRVTGILPLAARSRNSPGGGGKAARCVGAGALDGPRVRPLRRGGACPARLSDTRACRRAIRESPLRGMGKTAAERTGRRPVIANQRRNAGVAIRILSPGYERDGLPRQTPPPSVRTGHLPFQGRQDTSLPPPPEGEARAPRLSRPLKTENSKLKTTGG